MKRKSIKFAILALAFIIVVLVNMSITMAIGATKADSTTTTPDTSARAEYQIGQQERRDAIAKASIAKAAADKAVKTKVAKIKADRAKAEKRASRAAAQRTQTSLPTGSKGEYQAYAKARVSASQWPCLRALWQRESSWRPTAVNGSHFGIPQMKGLAHSTGWKRQIERGLGYIDHRYSGSPCKALAHSDRHNWY